MRALDPGGPPPLARLARLGPGKLTAVDAAGRVFDVAVTHNKDGAGNLTSTVTVTREGRSLTVQSTPGGADNAACELAGTLTGEWTPARRRGPRPPGRQGASTGPQDPGPGQG
jgi:hypothetical protein